MCPNMTNLYLRVQAALYKLIPTPPSAPTYVCAYTYSHLNSLMWGRQNTLRRFQEKNRNKSLFLLNTCFFCGTILCFQNIESRLKVLLPDDVGAALMDGVVLCHLANHICPRSVASIHVPSPAVVSTPKHQSGAFKPQMTKLQILDEYHFALILLSYIKFFVVNSLGQEFHRIND